MELYPTLLPAATAFGIALLHSLWIGLLAYALVRTITAWFSSATAKYYLAYAALWLVAAGSGYAFYVTFQTDPICENLLALPTNPGVPITLSDVTPVSATNWSALAARYAPMLSIAYLLGFIPACYLLGRSQYRINRLKTLGLSDLPIQWVAAITEIVDTHPATRNVRTFFSDHAREVMTVGLWQPIIVLPVALASRLSPAMAHSLLLHEIAHLRHYDHFLNYPQQLLRVLFFYHPAVHALSRFIDREREHRCDDWVTRQTTDKHTYATALVTVARYSHPPSNPLVMSATKSPFSSRIHRLFNPGEAPESGRFVLSAVVLLALVAGHFSLNDQGAAAGEVDCLEEQNEVVKPQQTAPGLPTIVVVGYRPEKSSPTQTLEIEELPPPAAPTPLNLAPAPAPLLPTVKIDTLPSGEVKHQV